MVSYNGEWKQSGEHSGWTFSGKESKGLNVSRDITYANLIDHLYDLLGFERSKYDLVLKVVYQLGGGIIASTMITNDEDLGFFFNEISILIQYRTPLCVSVVERTIPTVLYPTQDNQIPSFVPEMAEVGKIHGHEVVPRQPACEAPINDDPKVEPSLSPYYE